MNGEAVDILYHSALCSLCSRQPVSLCVVLQHENYDPTLASLKLFLLALLDILSFFLWFQGEIQSMEAFDHLLSGPVSEYMKCSTAIGGDVAKHVSTECVPVMSCQCRFYRDLEIQAEKNV